jgi:hypothetical protein
MRIPDAWILGNREFSVLGIINHVLKPSLPYGSESCRIRIDKRRVISAEGCSSWGELQDVSSWVIEEIKIIMTKVQISQITEQL